MKRDFDLIRAILIQIEGEDQIDLSEYTEKQINYHKVLLIEAGFLEGKPHYSGNDRQIPDMVAINRMTWEGHEFIDKARSQTIWDKAKKIIKEKGLSISVDILKTILPMAIKEITQSK